MLIKETPEELEQQARSLYGQANELNERANRLRQERSKELRQKMEEMASIAPKHKTEDWHEFNTRKNLLLG